MDKCPSEIILNILQYVPTINIIGKCVRVCTIWRKIIYDCLRDDCKDFEDFILSENLYYYSNYLNIINSVVTIFDKKFKVKDFIYGICKIDSKNILRKIIGPRKKVGYKNILYWAIQNNYCKITTLLLENINSTDYDKNKILLLAMKSGNLNLCNTLKIYLFDLTPEQYLNALRLNIYEGNLTILKKIYSSSNFLSDRAIINYLTNIALNSGHLHIIDFMHEMGGNILDLNNSHLEKAIDNNNPKLFKYIYTYRQNKTKLSTTLVDKIINYGNLSLVKFLFEESTDENLNVEHLLFLAVQNGHYDILKFLHTKNLDSTINNKLMHVAYVSGHIHIVDYFLELGISKPKNLCGFIKDKYYRFKNNK